MSERTKFVMGAAIVMASLAALIIGLTFGLVTPALEDGGSPPGPFPPLPSEEPTDDTPTGIHSVHVHTLFSYMYIH